jgi:glycerate kinase
MKVLIAPDKFKGSLSAIEAAEAIGRGIRKVVPDAQISLCPIADGGEGTAEALCSVLGGEWVSCTVEGPLGTQVEAQYCWVQSSATAVMEMSAASGLRLLDRSAPLRPRDCSTYGTGQMIKDAMQRGAQRIIVGLGGSATTDGGAGMAAALGYEFFTSDGELMERPTPANLLALIRIKGEEVPDFPEIVVASDVRNPLLGELGSARVFSPQKGATEDDVQALEWALEHLADMAAEDLGKHFRDTPGAGAAGGLGFGLLTFCNATIQSGFELVAEMLQLEKLICEAELVLTGEGSLDSQSIQGKGPVGLALMARAQGKPVIGFAGRIEANSSVIDYFDAIVPLCDEPIPLDESLRRAAELLERAAERAMRLVTLGQRR